MKFGLHSVNLHSCGYPDAAARFGRVSDQQSVGHDRRSDDVVAGGRSYRGSAFDRAVRNMAVSPPHGAHQ